MRPTITLVKPKVECDHYDCRCARAAELGAMGRTLEAVMLHVNGASVRCRRPELATIKVGER
jgi:hypothetical protein